jgi:hypothetical protein
LKRKAAMRSSSACSRALSSAFSCVEALVQHLNFFRFLESLVAANDIEAGIKTTMWSPRYRRYRRAGANT